MKKDNILLEVLSHYEKWTDDVTQRINRVNGWKDITDAYYGKLPDDWAFITRIVDPRIKTTLLEKNARLTNGKLKGRFVPREGGDILGAKVNSALIDFQWDMANDGGPMSTKITIADLDTRLYQSKFTLNKWKCVYDKDGEVEYEGNDCQLLDIRDCGIDFSAQHIRGAKWFQHRSWEFVEDLQAQVMPDGKPAFKNLDKVTGDLANPEFVNNNNSEKRSTEYTRRVLELRGLTDHASEDIAFPIVEIVTEYREDRWITFAPNHNVILRDISNPYEHGKIPVSQLRYYPIQDDPLGESEVEPVLPLWKAIQATICAYMDEVMLKMRPPLKIVENLARIETVVYGPEAQWIVSDINAIQEMQSNGDSLRYFQTTYSSLVSAFNNAMGGLSQGVSAVDPMSSDKTATEVKAVIKQQNVRDQKNQSDLVDFIKDIIGQWRENNKQFLFSDPKKSDYVLKIVGRDMFDELKQMGLNEMDLSPEVAQMIGDIIQQNPNISDAEINSMVEAGKTPRYPVFKNPNEKNPEKLEYKPKMVISDQGSVADLYITPGDLEGEYDYIPDIQALSSSATNDNIQARQQAFSLMTNPVVVKSLLDQGYQPDMKEIISGLLDDLNLKNGEKYFKQISATTANPNQIPGTQPDMQIGGLPNSPQAGITGGIQQQVAGPVPSQVPQGIPQAVQ